MANKVEVLSLKAGEKTGWLWISDGKGSYTLDEHLKDSRGTQITLHLKDEASEYLLEERLKQIVADGIPTTAIPFGSTRSL